MLIRNSLKKALKRFPSNGEVMKAWSKNFPLHTHPRQLPEELTPGCPLCFEQVLNCFEIWPPKIPQHFCYPALNSPMSVMPCARARQDHEERWDTVTGQQPGHSQGTATTVVLGGTRCFVPPTPQETPSTLSPVFSQAEMMFPMSSILGKKGDCKTRLCCVTSPRAISQ